MKSEQYIQKAYRCILQNDFEGALHWFEEAVTDNPADAETRYRCSITYARSNKLDQALVHAEQACLLEPENQDYKLHVGRLKAMKYVQEAKKTIDGAYAAPVSDLYQAVAILKEAIRLDPLYGEAFIWLAIAYSQLNEYALAISTIKEVISLYPDEDGLQEMLEQLKIRFSTYLQDSSN